MSDGIVIRDGDIEALAAAVRTQSESITKMSEVVRAMAREVARQGQVLRDLTDQEEGVSGDDE